jgi:hypothetical protein
MEPESQLHLSWESSALSISLGSRWFSTKMCPSHLPKLMFFRKQGTVRKA